MTMWHRNEACWRRPDRSERRRAMRTRRFTREATHLAGEVTLVGEPLSRREFGETRAPQLRVHP